VSIRSYFKRLLERVMAPMVSPLERRLASIERLLPSDLKSMLQWKATVATAEFIEDQMPLAKAMDSWDELMDLALSYSNRVEGGLFCEFGVYSGNSINKIAKRVKSCVHGFDSFKGIPEAWRDGFGKSHFQLSDGVLPKCEPNVKLIIGQFKDSLPGFMRATVGPAAFLHIDCDLYSSTKTVLESFADRIVPGTVIVFDEYFNYPGWKNHEHRAWSEFATVQSVKYEYLCYNRFHEQVALVVTECAQASEMGERR
jgi:Macrocin-O-methyltransferase (TylF)